MVEFKDLFGFEMNMNLETMSQWAEVIGVVTIFGAAVYSWFQIKELRNDRKADASLRLAELWQSKDFAHGSISIWFQPDDIKTLSELEEYHGDLYANVFTVLLTWESIGITLHSGYYDFNVVKEQFGMTIVTTWQKNKTLIEHFRTNFDAPGAFEWLQWIAERMMENNADSGLPPAHIRYKNWKPRT